MIVNGSWLGELGRFGYSEHTITQLFAYGNRIAWPVVQHKELGGGRTGGVWTFYQSGEDYTGLPMAISTQFPVGDLNPQKQYRSYMLSLEKPSRGARLGALNSYVADRDPEAGRYGGAMTLSKSSKGLWASFSGWPELVDIVFVVFVLQGVKVLTDQRVDEIFADHGEVASELKRLFMIMTEVCPKWQPSV